MSLSEEKIQNEILEFVYQTPIGICETDKTGNIIRMNPFFTQLLFSIINNYNGKDIPNVIEVFNNYDNLFFKNIEDLITFNKKKIIENYDINVYKNNIKKIRLKCKLLNEDRLLFIIEDISNLVELEEKRIELEKKQANMATIFALAKLAESRDDDTGKHIERVQIFCRIIANELKNIKNFNKIIDKDFIETISLASPLHDIGKVGIRDNILLKPDKLTKEEFEEMKKHTIIGAKTLEEVLEKFPDNKFIKIGIYIAKYHHEKWDGSGYPEGLKYEDIPLEARIMAVVDVYDALRSKRVYKPSFSHEETIDIIYKLSGSHFDPEIISVFKDINLKFKETYNSLLD